MRARPKWRTSVPRTDDANAATERRRIEDAIEKLKDQRAQLQAAIEAAEAQKTLIGNLIALIRVYLYSGVRLDG